MKKCIINMKTRPGLSPPPRQLADPSGINAWAVVWVGLDWHYMIFFRTYQNAKESLRTTRDEVALSRDVKVWAKTFPAEYARMETKFNSIKHLLK